MKKTLIYWIIASIIGLILFTAIQAKGQQFTNKFMDDTLMLFKHWGGILYIDTTNDDTTFFGDNIRSNEGFISDVCAQAYKAEYNIASQLGAYVHGVKVELTRTADIQPSTGCWFGGQFVLNAGTTAWDDINKPAYVVHGVVKGDQWDGTHDVNAGRFELQSSGSVRDIVYILANTGTSVSSSMLYMPTHVNVPNIIQFNVQSSATVTNGIDFVSGGGGSFNYGIDFSGATINTADIKFGNGALAFNKHADSLEFIEAVIELSGESLLDSFAIGSGAVITKIVKVGSHLAIILSGSDTLWAAEDTTGF